MENQKQTTAKIEHVAAEALKTIAADAIAATGETRMHPEIVSEMESLGSTVATLVGYNELLNRAQTAVDMYLAKHPAPPKEEQDWWGYQGKISVGSANGLGTVNCVFVSIYEPTAPQLKLIMRLLGEAGFRKTGDRDDCPEMGRRSYLYKERFRLMAFFSDLGENGPKNSCRFVKVGVEEKPVFELQCGGETIEDDS